MIYILVVFLMPLTKYIFIFLLSFGHSGYAIEYIKQFDTRIDIKSTGDVYVTETIEMMVNKNINGGIYRDFQTTFKTGFLTKSTMDLEVIAVSINDYPEEYHTIQLKNGVRVYMGDYKKRVAPGLHVYQLAYRTNLSLMPGQDYDQFYWNIVGYDWSVPFEKVTAEIHLPENVPIASVNSEAWTGFTGEENADYGSEISGEVIRFFTTKRLQPYQGMTLRLDLPKNSFTKSGSTLSVFISDNLMWILTLVSLVSLMVFYFLAWHRLGRNPESGVIIARFYPPRKLSPAATRFIMHGNCDHKALATAIINLAVKGYIKIRKIPSGYELTKLIPDIKTKQPLSSGESIIYFQLFKHKNQFLIEDLYNHEMSEVMQRVSRRLKLEYQSKCFADNRTLGFFGIAVSVFVYVFYLIHLNLFNGEMLGVNFISLVIIGFVAFQVYQVYQGRINWMWIVFACVSVVIFFRDIIHDVELDVLLLGLFLMISNVIFINLLKAPTKFGRKLMDEIEGFKLYLSTAEQHRLDTMHPPEMTPKIFERYLPYALALDVENKWSSQFARYLDLARKDGSASYYQIDWYTGGSFRLADLSENITDLCSDIVETIAEAETEPDMDVDDNLHMDD